MDPKAKKSSPKSKTSKNTQPLDPVLEVKKLAELEKWKETDLNQFLKCLSEYPYPKTPDDTQSLFRAIAGIPKEQRTRAIFTLIHQDYLDFVEGKTKHKFTCISPIRAQIREFLIPLTDLEESQVKTLELPSDLERLQKLFSERLNLPVKQVPKESSEGENQENVSDDQWEGLSRIERLRLLSTAIVCINDSNPRNDSKLPIIYEAIDLLMTVFLNPSEKSFKKDNIPFGDKEIAKHKLKVLFEELQEKGSERQLKALYDFERPSLEQIKELRWNNEELQRRNRSLIKANTNVDQQLNDAENLNQTLSSQVEEYREKIEQLEEKIKHQDESYSRFQQTSEIQLSQTLNSELSQLKSRISHEFEKLQRGIEKYITDDDVKSRFLEIMSKIENSIKVND